MPFAIFGFCIFWVFLLNFDIPSCQKVNQEQNNANQYIELSLTIDSKGVKGVICSND